MEGKMPEAYRIREALKNTLRVAVINKERYKEKLEHIPHEEYMDLAIVPIVGARESAEAYRTTVLERSALGEFFEDVGEDADSAMKDVRVIVTALRNAMKKFPPGIVDMRTELLEIINEVSASQEDDELLRDLHIEAEDAPEIYIASTKEKYMGAGVIAYPGFAEEAARKVGGSYYIIPSSVHELILVPGEREDWIVKGMKELVRSVNRELVQEQERLSDSIYFYDNRSRKLNICE